MIAKTLLFVLVGILGTSWLLDGGSYGLASAKIMERRDTSGNKHLNINDVPKDPSRDPDLVIGIWAGDTFYNLPNAPHYKIEIRKGNSVSTSSVNNPFYGNNGGKIEESDEKSSSEEESSSSEEFK